MLIRSFNYMKKAISIWDKNIILQALVDSIWKLDPRKMMKNPVMFVVEVGAAFLTVKLLAGTISGSNAASFVFELQITLWLWFTVLFANFAEAMAEGRGKAQADTLRKSRTETTAKLINGATKMVPAADLRKDNIVLVEAGDFIPGDGEIIEGVASVDESAITGESAPVIREAGGDRSAVTGGTKVLSDWIKVRITSNPGETFIDRMIALVEGAQRQKTPNEIALNILLAGLTIVFLLAVVTLQPFAIYSNAPQTIFVLVSLLVCLIPTTIERPSGVSSASDDNCAASANSVSSTPGKGINAVACRLQSVIVPVLSNRSVFTSPAASTARPDIASTLC